MLNKPISQRLKYSIHFLVAASASALLESYPDRHRSNPTSTHHQFNTTTAHPYIHTMFRTAVLRASRAICPASIRTVAVPRLAAVAAPVKPAYPMGVRYYSAPASLSKEEVEGRIKDLLKGFDKVGVLFPLGQDTMED